MSWQPSGPETGHPGALLALGTALSAWAPLLEPWGRQPLRGLGLLCLALQSSGLHHPWPGHSGGLIPSPLHSLVPSSTPSRFVC